MHLSAILVTDDRSLTRRNGSSIDQQRKNPAGPLACAEIFGESVLERTVAHLRKAGVRTIAVIAGPGHLGAWDPRDVKVTIANTLAERRAAAASTFRKHLQHKISSVLVAELGAYVEWDVVDALRLHAARRQPATPLHDGRGPLRYWILDTALMAASGLHLPWQNGNVAASVPYFVPGYVNRIADAHDFRQLVVDAFMGRCTIGPRGREVKPGVWLDDGVQVHKAVRLVAPAYLGRETRVRTGAVITRFSNLERHSTVGEGSLVDRASVLPNTLIGSGLDVSGALVDGGELVDLRRDVTLNIQDRNLIADAVYAQAQNSSRRRRQATLERPISELDFEYSQYLSRAAGRLLEVFKGEV